ncbi:MoaD/ThiS family protein [Candidatus Poribacteria bacterium]|nr:MoaD/ThiS family protein [Candidatus Poribacteria bacterium]
MIYMKIKVKMFANLAKLLPPGSQNKQADLTIKSGAKVQDVLDKLKVPPKLTNVFMVNGSLVDKETELKDGDILSVFPPVSGG